MTERTHELIRQSVALIERAVDRLTDAGGAPEHRSETISVLRRAAAASRENAPLIMAEIHRERYTLEIKRLRDRLLPAIEAATGTPRLSGLAVDAAPRSS